MVSDPFITDAELDALEANLPSKRVSTVDRESDSETDSKNASKHPSKPLRRGKYPWHIWANGEYHTATRGEDFEIPRQRFQVLLHRHAGDNDLYCRTSKVDEITIGFMYGTSKAEVDAKWDRLVEDYDAQFPDGPED